ncbi:GntR family transcriptional regulator [Terracidiphilus gabretensis]|uniref:GntR family transcriptional regulator n=1 Tax=Terracidiphilus gabretensis TaxID=1577687 RepID=UPI00071B009C|nr:GntR family transcriptional regulator [Terracidiphilus gabretensis]
MEFNGDIMHDLDSSSEAPPKYKQIADMLRAKICSLEYPPGDKLPSDSELSKHFSSSRLTVIRALRQLESEGLVERKAGSGTYVGLQRDNAAHSFGLLFPNLGEGEIFEPICAGLARAGSSSQQALIWGNISNSSVNKEAQALELCNSFIARRVDGVFFAPLELTSHTKEINQQIVNRLDEASIPIILLDRSIQPFPEPTQHDLVGIDNWREGCRMAKYLLDLGCTRLGFVGRPGSAPTVNARIAGLSEAMRQYSSGMSSECILMADPTDIDTVQRWVEVVRPDGVLCATDYTAGQLMHTLAKLGIAVPQTIRLVGFDDVRYASILPVPLTTLRQPCLEIGIAAMKAMLARLEDPSMVPRTISLDCELIVRASCGANPNYSMSSQFG